MNASKKITAGGRFLINRDADPIQVPNYPTVICTNPGPGPQSFSHCHVEDD